jgi:hypothetical protein
VAAAQAALRASISGGSQRGSSGSGDSSARKSGGGSGGRRRKRSASANCDVNDKAPFSSSGGGGSGGGGLSSYLESLASKGSALDIVDMLAAAACENQRVRDGLQPAIRGFFIFIFGRRPGRTRETGMGDSCFGFHPLKNKLIIVLFRNPVRCGA